MRAKGADQNSFVVGTFQGSPPYRPGPESLMIFHNTSGERNPGVGDYEVATTMDKVLKKTPKATIGRGPRFLPNKLKDYEKTTAHQYVRKVAILLPKPKLGTIGTEKRFTNYKKIA